MGTCVYTYWGAGVLLASGASTQTRAQAQMGEEAVGEPLRRGLLLL